MAGISNAFFIVEIDGVSVLQASEVEIGGIKHEPFKLYVGDRPNPFIGRNKHEIEEVKIKQAYALNQEGSELFGYFYDYMHGLTTEKLNIRVVQLDEDGYSDSLVHQFYECVPTSYKPDGKKADSKDAAMFEISFKPTDYEEI